jgi:hypothetical protein
MGKRAGRGWGHWSWALMVGNWVWVRLGYYRMCTTTRHTDVGGGGKGEGGRGKRLGGVCATLQLFIGAHLHII